MIKTKRYGKRSKILWFGSFEFWSFDIVSDFGFRASDLDRFHFLRQSHLTLTCPEDQVSYVRMKWGLL